MNRNVLIIIGFLSIATILYLVFRGPDITNYPLKSDGPVVAFGDSLVAGYGSTKGNDFVALLSKGLGEPILNLGVPGDTTAGGLSRIQDVIDEKPRLALVVLGGNDFLRKVPREETFANLRTIIDRLQASGSIVVLIGVRGGLFTDSADSLYKDLAEDTGSVYVEDVLDGLFGDARYMSDSVHPNDAGYQKIAERLFPIIKRYSR